MKEIAERIVFIIKDEIGNYCGSNSIQYDKQTDEYEFVYAEKLRNAFFLCTEEQQCIEILAKLVVSAKQIHLDKIFYIEKIDFYKVLAEENRLKTTDDKYPFIHERVSVGKVGNTVA